MKHTEPLQDAMSSQSTNLVECELCFRHVPEVDLVNHRNYVCHCRHERFFKKLYFPGQPADEKYHGDKVQPHLINEMQGEPEDQDAVKSMEKSSEINKSIFDAIDGDGHPEVPQKQSPSENPGQPKKLEVDKHDKKVKDHDSDNEGVFFENTYTPKTNKLDTIVSKTEGNVTFMNPYLMATDRDEIIEAHKIAV